MTDTPDCCRNCQFSVMEVTADRGTCNRHAPTPALNTGWAIWPSISGLNWCGEWELHPTLDLAPRVTPQEAQAFADFLAHSDPIPGFSGFLVPPNPEQGPGPIGLQVTTYDDPFEDPLR